MLNFKNRFSEYTIAVRTQYSYSVDRFHKAPRKMDVTSQFEMVIISRRSKHNPFRPVAVLRRAKPSQVSKCPWKSVSFADCPWSWIPGCSSAVSRKICVKLLRRRDLQACASSPHLSKVLITFRLQEGRDGNAGETERRRKRKRRRRWLEGRRE